MLKQDGLVKKQAEVFTSMYENLLVDKKDKVTVVTINRPQALNALNTGVLNDLESFFKKTLEDKATRVIILTGSGEKAFVAGADIKEISTLNLKPIILIFLSVFILTCKMVVLKNTETAMTNFLLMKNLNSLSLMKAIIYAMINHQGINI